MVRVKVHSAYKAMSFNHLKNTIYKQALKYENMRAISARNRKENRQIRQFVKISANCLKRPSVLDAIF